VIRSVPNNYLGFETLLGQNTALKPHTNQEFVAIDQGFRRPCVDTPYVMSNPLGPLTTRELLARTVRIYGQHMFLFIGISALPYLCWLVIFSCFRAALPSFAEHFGNAVIAGAVWIHRHLPFIPFGIVKNTFIALSLICVTLYGIVPLLLKVLAGGIATAATSIGITDIYLDRKATVIGCLLRLEGKLRKVLYAVAAICVTTGAGLILLLIPGIYWACRDGLAVPAVVLEEIKGSQARARSAALTKGSVGRILLIYVVFALLEYAIRLALGFVLYFTQPIAGKFAGIPQPDVWVWTVIVLTITTPFIAIALTLAYYDQRVRLEGFNLETVSGTQQAPPVPNSIGVTP
jgi:hypothetical protein